MAKHLLKAMHTLHRSHIIIITGILNDYSGEYLMSSCAKTINPSHLTYTLNILSINSEVLRERYYYQLYRNPFEIQNILRQVGS